MYSNYHKHDHYSNIVVPDSVATPEEYARRAIELGHQLIASTNHGWQGRYIEYYELAKKYNLKFLFGVESYIVKDRFEKDSTNAHIVLLAKNENGRKNINRILSEAATTGFYYKPRIDFSLLFSLPKDDVWITTACVGGIWRYENADELILKIHDYFGNNLFLEVQNHNVDSQKILNKRIINLSNRYGIKTIFGCDSHYVSKLGYKDRDDYLLSKHIEYEDEKGWAVDYPDEETVVNRFLIQGILNKHQITEAIENTNIFLNVEEYNSPVFTTALKLPTIYKGKSAEEKNRIFTELIWQKWDEEKSNVPEEKWQHYISEITKELDIIVSTNMADYFLLDYEVVKRGKELGGTITMTGRGSAPSMYLSKLLGFTTIDRISAKVKLFPERFITKERILQAGTLPDIDFNLGKPEIFAEAQKQILGEDSSYPMLAYGTMQPKAAWKLYARAKNIDFDTANAISGQIEKFELDYKHTEDEVEKEQLNILDYIDEKFHAIFLDSKKYLGIVSDGKQHPCGYVLFDGNIREEIGLVKLKENICSVMDGLWAENYKFLKNDLLKVSVVDLIYRVYDRIGVKPHPLPELIKICENDPKVWEVYKNAWTMGINQVEQTSTSGRVAKYAPKNISELSAFVAAVRPGFKSNYKQFESREQFSYGVPSLDKIIQTDEFPQSYMIYQENAMQVMAYAGIPISETYEVVKNIAKKRPEKVFKYREQFIVGMMKNIIQEENTTKEKARKVAEQTWKILEDSSRYSFNSSHSYSVAGDSLYGAYLKSHYPLEFYETFLRILEEDGSKDRLKRAKNEAERAYKIVFPPYRFGQDNRKIVANPETHEITSSLSSIKGFGNAIGNVMYELSQIPFDNFLDLLVFSEENGFMSNKISDLIKINYFEKFGNNKKLQTIYDEFTEGKSRYSKTHSDKTKEKRLLELKEIWNNTENERFAISQQLAYENEILGYIQAVYPINKRYLYALSVDTKFAPRVEFYCLANGKINSLKIQNKKYENNVFYGGDILYANHFIEKPSVRFVEGKYVEDDTEKTWWLDDYQIINPEEFDKNIAIGLDK